MRKIFPLIMALLIILSLSFGCAGLKSLVGSAETDVWREIYDIARTGEVRGDVFYKLVEFEDGFGFYFGTSPTDNSIAILSFSITSSPSGVAVQIKDGKAHAPQMLQLTPFGMMGLDVDILEAERIANELLGAYREKLKTTPLKIKGLEV